MVLAATLAACAEARVAPQPYLDMRGNELGGSSPEQGPGGDARTEFPDSAPPTEAGGDDLSLPDSFATVDLAPPLDIDGDGHCAPGSTDPGGKCKSYKDCNDTNKTVYPGAAETCTDVGTDNDCDGDKKEVDLDHDGVNDLGSVCKKGLPGICDEGTRHCKLGALVCVGKHTAGQVQESCNGKDDDCDGKTDEGQLCGNNNTCQGSGGCRCNGGSACVGPYSCCSAGCKQLDGDTLNCGACNIKCGPGESCSGGSCRCGSTVGAKGGGPACGAASCNGSSCGDPCDPSKNLASSASPSSSGGGASSTGYGPERMNDNQLESACPVFRFHWISAGTSLGGGKWIQYSWSKPVTVGRVWFDTLPSSGGCTTAGRTLAGGRLQYRKGSSWVTLSTTSYRTNDWSVSFSPVTTNQLRLYDAHARSVANPVIFEWRVFCK